MIKEIRMWGWIDGKVFSREVLMHIVCINLGKLFSKLKLDL